MTNLAALRAFALGLIDEANHQEDEAGAAGAHEAITVRGLCERVVADIDATPPATPPDRIPPAIRAGLDRYSRGGIRPGSLVYAVLANDLVRAFIAADPEARDAMPAIVEYVRQSVPSAAWGSPEAVERWIARPRS